MLCISQFVSLALERYEEEFINISSSIKIKVLKLLSMLNNYLYPDLSFTLLTSQSLFPVAPCYPPVLVRVFIPAQTSWPRSKLGRKGFIWLTLPYCCSSPRKSGLELKQVRKQELMQRPWRDVLYWLASPGLLSLLSYRTQDYQPRDGPTHKGPFPLDH